MRILLILFLILTLMCGIGLSEEPLLETSDIKVTRIDSTYSSYFFENGFPNPF